jgi:hypothetical protein
LNAFAASADVEIVENVESPQSYSAVSSILYTPPVGTGMKSRCSKRWRGVHLWSTRGSKASTPMLRHLSSLRDPQEAVDRIVGLLNDPRRRADSREGRASVERSFLPRWWLRR